MEILPAIDLKEGLCVRLSKGEISSAKIYSDKPWELAKEFEYMGAKWLHLVDLDGAFAGESINFKTIEKIISNTNLKVEVGGGIRSEDAIIRYKNIGVERFILGSIAIKDRNFVSLMAKKYKIAVGIDAKNGKVAVEGWVKISDKKATELAREYSKDGVDAIICTDISKDGMLNGVNVKFSEEIADISGIKTIASGGVKDINDIISLKNSGKIYGVIVGKAYYEKTLNLKEAFKINI